MKKLASVILAVVAALVTLQPGVAHADSYVRHDAAQDVAMLDDNGNEVKAPDRADGDIVTSGVSYAGRRLWLAMSFSDLGHDSEFSGYMFALRTNGHKTRFLTIFATPGEGWSTMLGGRHGRIRCRGLAARVEYVARRVRAVIPKRCLGSPRWVQVSMATLTVKGENEDDVTVYGDDAILNGAFMGASWGPRVRRG
jgi:hypothetical protein